LLAKKKLKAESLVYDYYSYRNNIMIRKPVNYLPMGVSF